MDKRRRRMVNRMSSRNRWILAAMENSVAKFWLGAFIFGFPGVMGPEWQRMFHVGQGPIGHTLFLVLVAAGIFMFFCRPPIIQRNKYKNL